MAEENMTTTQLTATVVGAFVGNHQVAVSDLPGLIRSVYTALTGVESGGTVEAVADVDRPTAAQIRKSITPDALISFVDGRPFKSLRRHLGTHGMTPEEYRARYGLPTNYPMVAPTYSAARSAMAKSIGLGVGGRGGKGKPATVPAPVPKAKGRAKKPT